MSTELFIYWRLAAVDVDDAARAMAAFQEALRLRYGGLQARVMRRIDDQGDKATLMETYALAGGVNEQLHTEIVVGGAQAAAAWSQGPRHVEVFEPLPT